MKKFTVLFLLCACSASLSAQNFDESVEVTNDLMVDMSGSQRKTIPVEIPDSLNQFRYNFDYSVFETPYRGAYEFTPYNVLFKPSVRTEELPFLYLRAGAGYTLNPVADVIVAPRFGDKFSMNIYQRFNGFWGEYRGAEDNYKGHEFNENLGVRGSASLNLVELDFDVFYKGLWARDFALGGSPFHTFGASVGVASVPVQGGFMDYNVQLSARTSQEHAFPGGLTENALSISGELLPLIEGKAMFRMDFDTGFNLYGGALSSAMYYMKTAPKVLFSFWKAEVSAGAGFSYYSSEGRNRLLVYPDLKASLKLFNNTFELYLGCTGGDRLNSYYTYKQDNPHFSFLYAGDPGFRTYSREAYNAFAGFKGLVGRHFSYDIRGGYSYNMDMPLYGLSASDPNQAVLLPASYHRTTLAEDFRWNSRHFDIKSGFVLNRTDVGSNSDAFDLPAVTAYADFTYKLMDRYSMGFGLNYVSARKSRLWAERPQYLDLGLHCGAVLSPNLTIWLEGSNLLDRRVEYVPMTGKAGPNITFGIVLNFR